MDRFRIQFDLAVQDGEISEHQWSRIVEAVSAVFAEGLQPKLMGYCTRSELNPWQSIDDPVSHDFDTNTGKTTTHRPIA